VRGIQVIQVIGASFGYGLGVVDFPSTPSAMRAVIREGQLFAAEVAAAIGPLEYGL